MLYAPHHTYDDYMVQHILFYNWKKNFLVFVLGGFEKPKKKSLNHFFTTVFEEKQLALPVAARNSRKIQVCSIVYLKDV